MKKMPLHGTKSMPQMKTMHPGVPTKKMVARETVKLTKKN